MRLIRLVPLALLTSLICTLDVRAVEEVVTNATDAADTLTDETTKKSPVSGFSIGYRTWLTDIKLRRGLDAGLDMSGLQASVVFDKYFIAYKSLSGSDGGQQYYDDGCISTYNRKFEEQEYLVGRNFKHLDLALGLKRIEVNGRDIERCPDGTRYTETSANNLDGIVLQLNKQINLDPDVLAFYGGLSTTYFYDIEDGLPELLFVFEAGLALRLKRVLLTAGYRYQDHFDDDLIDQGRGYLVGGGPALTAHLIF